jgi:hypothetical protein
MLLAGAFHYYYQTISFRGLSSLEQDDVVIIPVVMLVE